MRIAVLGAGSWGTTVASLLAAKHDCIIWARDAELAREIYERDANSRYLPGCTLPTALKATADLEKAVHDADLLVVGVPTHGFRAILADVRPYLRPWIPVVSLSKGFERGSLLRMTQVIRDELPGHPAAALTGPNLAKEIMGGRAAASVIATEDLAVAEALQAVLQRGMFRIYTNHDVIGCELGGALKNVIAIATGIAEGLGVGDNTRAAVICRGLAEVTRLGVAMGGEAATFAGLAGMGDLIATCMSPLSRNRTLGEQLGAGRTLEEILAETHTVAEGVGTAFTVHELGLRHGVEMPVCEEIYRVLAGEISALDAYRGLTRQRQAGHEREPG
ncbi:MAG: NAD(P)H-dependent glycerol-3-phosphate dehydrogenase [Streptosporangiaceae bacterium]